MAGQAYAPPTITEWGTVVDLTAGMGKTQFTDDSFTCDVGEAGDFKGSTGHCPPGQS